MGTRLRRCALLALLAIAAQLPAYSQPAEAARRAEAEFEIGHGNEAMALWKKALAEYRASGDVAGQMRVLDRLGTTANLMRQWSEANNYLAEALELARRSGNAALEAALVPKLADATARADDHPRAVSANRDLLARSEAAGDTAVAALAAARLGQALSATGRPEPAATAFGRAAELFRASGDLENESAALKEMGAELRRQERYVAAVEAYTQAAKVAREAGNASLEAQALHGLGVSNYYLGDYAAAAGILKDAIRIARRAGNRSTEAAALMSLGSTQYFQQQQADAVRSYEQVLVIARSMLDRKLEGQALGNLGLALGHAGDHERAADYIRQSAAIAKERGDRFVEAQALGNLALQLFGQGKYAEAVPLLMQSRALARAIPYRRGEAITLRNLGIAQLRSGQAAAAEASLREAIALQEALRGQTAGIDRSNVSLFETQLDAYRVLQAALVAQNRTDAALEVSERGRAQALVDLLAHRGIAPQRAPTLSIDAIRALARTRRETLVEFSFVPEDKAIYTWVVRPDGAVHFRRIGFDVKGGSVDSAIEGLVRDSRAAMGALGPRDVPKPAPGIAGRDEMLALFHRMLIAPLADWLPASPDAPVVLIPQGSLFLLPFAALRDERGRALIESHTLVVVPSIQALAQLGVKRAATGRAVVAGNPAMSDLRLAGFGNTPVQFAPLPAAEREAVAVARLLDTQALVGPAASKAAILARASAASVIHLATHGIAEDARAEGVPGALVLAPSGDDDGVLTALDIMRLTLQADLVVLSACNTGLGNISGDGVLGLSRAFLAAGAQSVVVSLWSVPDQPTSELMQTFYRKLAVNGNKAGALRQAMLETRARHPDPLAWAGFILVGDSR